MSEKAILSNNSLDFQNNDGTIVKMTATTNKLTFSGTGDTIIIDGVATPTDDNHVASKSYVDSVAEGLNVLGAVKVATISNLDYTYDNDTATLTKGTTGAVSIDGISLVLNDRVLVKNQTTSVQNGIYKVTTAGAAADADADNDAVALILTRSSDMTTGDSAASDFTFVEQGTVNADTGFVCTNNSGSAVVGTSSLTFTQFSGAGSITAGTNLSKSGNTIHLNDSVTHAGTLDVTGDTSVSTFDSTGATSLATGGGAVNIASSGAMTTVKGTLNVDGAVTLDTTLDVTGDVTVGTSGDEDADSTNNLTVTGNITGNSFITSSDRRLKKNIRVIKDCISKVKKIRGVNFTWIKDGRKDFGVIAQDIEKVAPFAVHEKDDGYKTVDYSKLSTLFINAIKEQQQIIEDQQSEIDGLKEQFEDLNEKMEKILNKE